MTSAPQPMALFSDCTGRCGGMTDTPGGKWERCVQRESVVRCIHGSAARGLAARIAEWEAWIAEHGNFGSSSRSHAWQPGLCVHTEPHRTLPADPHSRGPPALAR